MADFNAVANAIATRFSSANVTAPSGETNIRESTAALPDGITKEPVVLVYPPSSVELSYGPSIRKAIVTYPVRFYIYKIRDGKRNAVLINKWLTSLYDQLTGQVHLGLASYVNHADVVGMAAGQFNYTANGPEFHGIELTVNVYLGEGLAAVA
jgi:hypothetical protein